MPHCRKFSSILLRKLPPDPTGMFQRVPHSPKIRSSTKLVLFQLLFFFSFSFFPSKYHRSLLKIIPSQLPGPHRTLLEMPPIGYNRNYFYSFYHVTRKMCWWCSWQNALCDYLLCRSPADRYAYCLLSHEVILSLGSSGCPASGEAAWVKPRYPAHLDIFQLLLNE